MVRNLSLYTSLYTSHFSCTFLCRHVLYCPVCLSRHLFLSRLSLFYTSVLGWNARLDFFCFCRFLYDLFCFREASRPLPYFPLYSPLLSLLRSGCLYLQFPLPFRVHPHSPVLASAAEALYLPAVLRSAPGLFPALPSHAGLYPFFRLPDTRCALR